MLTWWYMAGWKTFTGNIRNWLNGITDFFSMNSLIHTLFKPFRQISAESADMNSSIGLRFNMFLDRTISRIVGFFARAILLIIGSIIIIFGGIICLVLIIIWPFVPLLPIAGIVLAISGVTL